MRGAALSDPLQAGALDNRAPRVRRAVDRGGAEGVFRHAARAAPGRIRRGGARGRGRAKMKAKTRMEKDEEDERGMR